MDPLSLTASTVAVLGFSASCAKQLRQLVHSARHAPTEVIALSNEVADLNVLLTDIEIAARAVDASPAQNEADDNFVKAALSQLERARLKFAALESLSSTLCTPAENGGVKLHRSRWIKKKSTAAKLQQELAEIRQSLGQLLASNNVSRTLRIELSLHGLSFDSAQPLTRDSELDVDLTLPALPDLPAPLEPNRRVEDETQEVPLNAHSSTARLPATSETHEISQLENSGPEMSTLLQTVRQIAQFSSLTFHVHRLARCEGTCQCVCHSRARFQSPEMLKNFFGALFVGYAGLPIMTKQCDERACTNQYSRTLHISYTFPGWFLSRTIDLVGAMTYTGEPSFGLKVRNRPKTDADHSIFHFARNGNVAGIIEMFRQRKASPNDLSFGGGHSLLHFPLELGHLETCKFLVDLGVDPYFEDDNGNSAARQVSTTILTSKRSTGLVEAYESIFTGISSNHSELWDFSFIHRVVVGIHPADLSATLLDPVRQSEINTLDVKGRSPLFWASLRGDHAAVQTLLEAGADIKPVDHEKRNALHAALTSGSLRAVELLLLAGGSVHTRDGYGDTAIQIATWAHNTCEPDSNVPILRTVYLAGASPNARNSNGISAIQSAACLNRVANGEYLLSIQADCNNVDAMGDVPVFECLLHNTHGMLDLLLRHPGTRTDLVNKVGWTILHFAALKADLRSLERLSAVRLHGVDVEGRDSKGRTAREVFELRAFPPNASERAAFTRLLGQADGAEIIPSGLIRRISDDNEEDTAHIGTQEINLSLDRSELGIPNLSVNADDVGDDELDDDVFVDALETLTLHEEHE